MKNISVKLFYHRINLGALSIIQFMAISLILFAAIIFIPIVYAVEGQVENPPILNISETIHDFGIVVEGEQVFHDFLVQNHGASFLEIQKVITK